MADLPLTVLVTGAEGFVGRALCPALQRSGHRVVGVGRSRPEPLPEGISSWLQRDIEHDASWNEALCGVDAVVHLAARVHVLGDASDASLEHYRRANVEATVRLALAAAEAGVRRFVFASSVKVCGEATYGIPFSETQTPAPVDSYGRSKLEAERELLRVQERTGLEVVILRPPLMYGPGVKANFQRLVAWVRSGIPLPLGSVKNRRSLLFVGNFVSALECVLEHPQAGGNTYLVCDGEDVSTAHLVRRLATAMGRPARLVPVPTQLLAGVAGLLGRTDAAARLLGDLQLDGSKIRQRLDWRPPYNVDAGLRATVARQVAEGAGPAPGPR